MLYNWPPRLPRYTRQQHFNKKTSEMISVIMEELWFSGYMDKFSSHFKTVYKASKILKSLIQTRFHFDFKQFLKQLCEI